MNHNEQERDEAQELIATAITFLCMCLFIGVLGLLAYTLA